MDKRSWFYGQTVTDSELDDAFDWVEDADHDLAVDAGLVGVHAGLTVTEQAVPDLTVQVAAGTATGPTGERIAIAAPATTVDCSVDRYGQATAVTGGAGFQKYLAIYARFTRTATNPAVDDNGVTVYTRQYEAMEFLVEQGAEDTPTATRPALLTDAVHLGDVLLVHAQAAITNSDLSVTRRGDWVREVLANRGTEAVYGTPATACAALWQAIDSLAGAAGADDVGVADYTTANAAVTWASATAQDALEATADAIDGHIVGGAPNHPASAISTAVIAGTPESEASPSTVQAVLTNVVGHLNARTERATNERVTASWDCFGDTSGATSDSHARLRGEVLTGTLAGGSWPRDATLNDLARCLPGDRNLSAPMAEGNAINFTNTPLAGHALIVRDSSLYTGRQRRLLAVVGRGLGASGAGTGSSCYLVDPADPTGLVATVAGLGGLPTGGSKQWQAMSVCSSGPNLYVQFYDASTEAWRIQGYDATSDLLPKLTAWPATGVDPTPAHTGLPGFYAFNPTPRNYAMCIASATRLAVLSGHIELTGAAGTALTVLNLADGASPAYGSGDVSTGADVISSGGLCSDGTNLYFTTLNHSTSVTTVNSAQVSSPGAGRAGFVKRTLGTASAPTENFCHCLVWTGETVVCPCEDGTVEFIWTTGVVTSLYVSRAKPSYIKKLRWACYDGLHVWLFGSWDNSGLEVGGVAAVRMDAAAEHVPSFVGGLETVATPVSMMTYEETLYDAIADSRNIGPAIFDGDAVWQILSDGKAVNSGNQRGIIRALRASSRR